MLLTVTRCLQISRIVVVCGAICGSQKGDVPSTAERYSNRCTSCVAASCSSSCLSGAMAHAWAYEVASNAVLTRLDKLGLLFSVYSDLDTTTTVSFPVQGTRIITSTLTASRKCSRRAPMPNAEVGRRSPAGDGKAT
jgi:hypothetical protein